MQPHKPIYRPIIKHALETAWIHRELWPIAAVAGLAGTGAVINDVLNQAKLAASVSGHEFSRSLGNLHILGVYRENILNTNVAYITFGTIVLILLAVGIAMAIAACQQVILKAVHGALKKRTHLSFKEIKRDFAHPRIFRFLTLDLLLKLLVINLMIASTLLIAQLNVSFIVSDAVYGLIFSATALAVALTFNVAIMLALIGITRQDLSIGKSLNYAWNLFRRHTFIFLEMSVLLFAINFLISAAYDGTILVLGVPAAFSFLGALETGSFAVYITLMSIVGILVLTLTLAFAGFATTFTYAAWTALVEHLDKKPFKARSTAHAKRFIDIMRT